MTGGLRLGRWVVSRYSVPRPAIRAAYARGRVTTRPLGPATRPAAGLAIRRYGRHDSAPSVRCARGLGAVGAQPGRSGRTTWFVWCAPMHPTQFWTQYTVSVTVWDTVHEHCSQDLKKKIIK